MVLVMTMVVMMIVVVVMVLVSVAGVDASIVSGGGVGGDGGGINIMMITNPYHYQLYHILLHCLNKYKIGCLYNNLPFTTL